MPETETQPAQDTTKAADATDAPASAVTSKPADAPASKASDSTTPAEVKAGEKKTENDPASEKPPAVPEKYELKLPDGSKVEASRVDEIAALAKEKGLTQEAAQELLTREHEAVSSFVGRQDQALEDESSKWVAELSKDKEFGGEAFAQNSENVKGLVSKFADQSFMDVLDHTGLGNHPGFFRMLARIAKASANDKLVLPGGSPVTKKSPADMLYGEEAKT